MATIRRIAYCSVVVEDRPGEGYRLLTQVAAAGVNLLAFHAIPFGDGRTQLVIFPERIEDLARVAEREAWVLSGPQHAFLIRGDDQVGVLAEWHRRLYEDGVNVISATGIADGRGGYAYLLHVRHEDVERVSALLGA